MDAIVLAGGLGTRLREVVPDVPKPLASIAGKPFLDLLLAQLATVPGLQRVVLAVGYKAEHILAHYEKHAPVDRLEFSIEDTPLGTGGAFKLAASLTESDPILVLNGDSYLAVPWPEFLLFHQHQGQAATLATVRQNDISRYGEVLVDPQGYRIVGFNEKQPVARAGLINGGVYLFNRTVLKNLPPQKAFSLEADLFPLLLDRGMASFEVPGKFIDIGTKNSYALAQHILMDL